LLGEAHLACGDVPSAFTSLEQALRLATDEEAPAVREKLAWLELEQGDPDRAAALFRQLLAERPGDAALDGGLRRAVALAAARSRPPQYGQALARSSINRGELAAILAVELGWAAGESPPGGRVRVITDIAGNWAAAYIGAVAARGVMDVYQNHTFRPGETITRGDLADAACRLLSAGAFAGEAAAGARGGGSVPSDLPPEHRRYGCVRRLLELGLMTPYADGTFRISGPVSGEQARQLILALRRLAGPGERGGRNGK
jgi:tetratricopeptide (TPR) repeat protein